MATKHSPLNFIPNDYRIEAYLDNRRPAYYGEAPLAYAEVIADWKADMVRELGIDWAAKANHCIHCGNGNVRWITAVLHIPTGEKVVFGSDCTERLGFANQDAFKLALIQSRAKAREVKIKCYLKREAFLAAHPEVVELLAQIDNPVHEKNSFAKDVLNKLGQYGELSDRQISAVGASMLRDVLYAERKATEAQEVKGDAPSGRAVVTGVVVSMKTQESEWGIVTKMLVKLPNNSKVWVTAPGGVERNDTVTVRATWTPKQDDKSFAFGSRPHLIQTVHVV